MTMRREWCLPIWPAVTMPCPRSRNKHRVSVMTCPVGTEAPALIHYRAKGVTPSPTPEQDLTPYYMGANVICVCLNHIHHHCVIFLQSIIWCISFRDEGHHPPLWTATQEQVPSQSTENLVIASDCEQYVSLNTSIWMLLYSYCVVFLNMSMKVQKVYSKNKLSSTMF